MPLPHEGRSIDETIAEDLLYGLVEIGRFIGESEYRTKELILQGKIPGTRVGKTFIGSKRHLRRHYDAMTGGFFADRDVAGA